MRLIKLVLVNQANVVLSESTDTGFICLEYDDSVATQKFVIFRVDIATDEGMPFELAPRVVFH